MNEKPEHLTLFELNSRVKNGLRTLFPDTVWIVAEISEMNTNANGHCYLELIEKSKENEQITARAKATIWAFTFRILRPYFESVTKQRFATGIKVMVQANIEFHELYGYSLNIKDIEPTFTIGDLARKRQEVIQNLQNDGVFELNKELDFPLVPQRIAVISSETAAGYGDFCDQLTNNNTGYSFYIQLFQATMQGNDAEQSIIEALERIFDFIEKFDIIVIIRGGGAQADLNCFNSYWLCFHMSQFPIPILTGIGHERDETIADLVAHTSLKTPTAVAEFILSAVTDFDNHITSYANQVFSYVSEILVVEKEKNNNFLRTSLSLVKLRMSRENQRISTLSQITKQSFKRSLVTKRAVLNNYNNQIKNNTLHKLSTNKQNITLLQKNLVSSLKTIFKDENRKLEKFENAAHLLDPKHILKRGYSISFSNGKIVKSVSQLQSGDTLENVFIDGSAIGIIKSLKYE